MRLLGAVIPDYRTPIFEFLADAAMEIAGALPDGMDRHQGFEQSRILLGSATSPTYGLHDGQGANDGSFTHVFRSPEPAGPPLGPAQA